MLKKKLLLSLMFGAALLGADVARAENIPSTPEPGTVKIALEPWLGYGQWC